MTSKKHKLVSAINNLRPYQVIDEDTGEILNANEWQEPLRTLIEHCQQKTQNTLDKYSDLMSDLLNDGAKIGAPTGFAWKYSIRPDLSDYPSDCCALSRVEKIIQHNTVSLFSSYYNNDTPKKNPPTASKLINLGAADKQIAFISLEDHILKLHFDCWNRHYLMFFLLPLYIDHYDIQKFCLPTIRWNDKNDDALFTFPIYENFSYSLDTKASTRKVITAAYDLGRKKPFVLSIVNHKGGVIAEYESSCRLRELNDKRERIIKEKKQIYAKIDSYEALGIFPDKVAILRQEVKLKTAKIKALGEQVAVFMGREIADLCVKHHVDVVACEDLSWVNESVGRSSKWNHSRQQDAVEHALKREGVRQVKRSARNTSRTCCECGSKDVTVSAKTRMISCKSCGSVVDRDRSSARFQARREALRRERARWRSLLEEQRAVVGSVSCDFLWFPVRDGVGAGLAVVPFSAQAWRHSVSTGLIELVPHVVRSIT